MLILNQRWLGIRLDFLATLLLLVVALLAVGTRFVISPAQTGVALSYIFYAQLVGRMPLRTEPLHQIIRVILVL